MKSKTALLKEIAEFLNEETEVQSMLFGALKRLVEGSEFSTGWIFSSTMKAIISWYLIMNCRKH